MVAQIGVFEKNKYIFTLIGFCQYDEGVEWHVKIKTLLISIILYGVNTFSLFTSILFAIQNMSIDLERTLYAIFQASAIFTVWYMMTESYFYRTEMAEVFKKYSKFYGKSE